MSHRFKKKLTAAERAEAVDTMDEIAAMAVRLEDDEQIEKLIEGAAPAEQNQMLALIAPRLSFWPKEETLCCRLCGRHRGAIREHECAVESRD